MLVELADSAALEASVLAVAAAEFILGLKVRRYITVAGSRHNDDMPGTTRYLFGRVKGRSDRCDGPNITHILLRVNTTNMDCLVMGGVAPHHQRCSRRRGHRPPSHPF